MVISMLPHQEALAGLNEDNRREFENFVLYDGINFENFVFLCLKNFEEKKKISIFAASNKDNYGTKKTF